MPSQETKDDWLWMFINALARFHEHNSTLPLQRCYGVIRTLFRSTGFIIVRALADVVSRWLPTAVARVRARVWQVGFVVNKVGSGQVCSEYFDFPCQNHFIPPTSPSSQSPGAVSRVLPTS
jgi:hypothetical protein